MELRQGITGFRHVDDPPLPTCDLRIFRTHCHDAARFLGGRVQPCGPRRKISVTNFAEVVIELDDCPIAVLLNHHYPVIGFAIPPSDTGLRFMDSDALAKTLNATSDYEVLSREELERIVVPDEFQQLLPAEIEQANYWRPCRLGDVIFNFWD